MKEWQKPILFVTDAINFLKLKLSQSELIFNTYFMFHYLLIFTANFHITETDNISYKNRQGQFPLTIESHKLGLR